MQLTWAGNNCFDVWTSNKRYAGLICQSNDRRHYNVFFDSNATRGSKRNFKSVDDAVEYIKARRLKKGWSI